MAQNNNKYSGRKLKTPDMGKERNFTQIPNAFILNPDISDPELRLLQYIMMNKDNWTIKTEDCIKYLNKTKPSIYSAFEGLIALGILRITDDIIEVVIPEDMKKYKVGYLKGKEGNFEVKKTLPTESQETIEDGKENLTSVVKKTLLEGKENHTKEVKKTYKKPLKSIDIDDVTSPIILYNTRVLPVPAKSGSTEQSHSNDNTKSNTGIGLDLECDSLQSLASPSVLAPSLHTPKLEVENGDYKSAVPIGDNNSEVFPSEIKTLPIADDKSEVLPILNNSTQIAEDLPQQIVNEKPLPTEPDKRYAEQLELEHTSKYFLPEKLIKVKELYKYYAEQYPIDYLPMEVFEKVLIYLMTVTVGRMVDLKGINYSLLYSNEIRSKFKIIPNIIQEMMDYPDDTHKLLKTYELSK